MHSSGLRYVITALVLAGVAGATWQYIHNRAVAAPLPGEIVAKDLKANIGKNVTFRGIAHLHYKIGAFVEVGDEQVLLSEMPANIADWQEVVVRGLLEFRTQVPIVKKLDEAVQTDNAGYRFFMKDETVTPIR